MAKRAQRRLAAIVAADVAGYSRLIGEDEEGTLATLLALRKELINPKVAEYRGRIANTAGDSLLIEFPSVVEALRCAIDIQRGTRERNSGLPEDRHILFRIGVNLGDVVEQDGDLLGDGVNVAARLETLAEPGSIYLSLAARDQVRDRLDVTLQDMGRAEVKNIARPIRVFRVDAEGVVAKTRKRFGRRLTLLAAGVVLIAIAAGSVAYWLVDRQGAEVAVLPGAAVADKPTIAVLPFVNLSQNPDEEYFTDGMTNDLITDLSKVSGLFVIARNSVFAYKGQAVNIQDVGRDLGARYLLEGSVRRAGDRFRVNAQLIDASTGHHLWAERYDRKQADVFAVQDEVISQIVSALSVTLTQSEQAKLSRPPTENLRAYDHYLRGEQHYHVGSMAALRKSIHAYEAAIAEDPGFAKAYAHYARAASDVWRLNYISVIPTPLAREIANNAARKAIELDPDNSDAHSVIALLKTVAGDHAAAVEEARRAVYLDRSNTDALLTLSIVLSYAGRHAEALEAVITANRLNPKPPLRFIIYHGLILIMNHQYERAAEILEPIQEKDSVLPSLGDSPREVLAMAYALKGRTAEAQSVVEQMIRSTSYLNLAYYRVIYEHYKRKEDLDFRIDALRKAGMPEWPLNYRGKPDHRLDAAEMKVLSFEATWNGWDTSRSLPFTREADADGTFVFANVETLMTGTVSQKSDMLCERIELLMLGREQCGFVYRNPDGTSEESNEYEYVNPSSIFRFSVAK